MNSLTIYTSAKKPFKARDVVDDQFFSAKESSAEAYDPKSWRANVEATHIMNVLQKQRLQNMAGREQHVYGFLRD